MATVTALGRYMVKTSRAYCEQRYGATALYGNSQSPTTPTLRNSSSSLNAFLTGDTDSIMVIFPFPRANMTEPECFDYLRKLCTKIGHELTALFAAPNEMEFESV